MSRNGHEDVATRLRREASATAPERLRADVMLRVRAEPRPQRIRPRRSFGRSLATVAAAACILGALVFGLSRVDFGGGSSSSGAGGGSAAAEAKNPALLSPGTGTQSPSRSNAVTYRLGRPDHQAVTLAAIPRPVYGAIHDRAMLAPALRKAFGALDPYHLRTRP